jgi:hypothetical protein
VEVAQREAWLQAVSCEERSVAGPLATAMAGAQPSAAVARERVRVSPIDWAHSLVVTGAREPVPVRAGGTCLRVQTLLQTVDQVAK